MFVRLATATAALALMSGVAMAQTAATQAPVNPDPTAAAPADQSMPADPSAATMAPADPSTAAAPAPTGTATDTAGVMTSSMPPEQQATLKAGDAGVTSNPPVADTPENRKLYGKPLSNAGKHTTAKGN
jgi:glucose/arabinose dehydrogenase